MREFVKQAARFHDEDCQLMSTHQLNRDHALMMFPDNHGHSFSKLVAHQHIPVFFEMTVCQEQIVIQ